jgi:hypothetical protein
MPQTRAVEIHVHGTVRLKERIRVHAASAWPSDGRRGGGGGVSAIRAARRMRPAMQKNRLLTALQVARGIHALVAPESAAPDTADRLVLFAGLLGLGLGRDPIRDVAGAQVAVGVRQRARDTRAAALTITTKRKRQARHQHRSGGTSSTLGYIPQRPLHSVFGKGQTQPSPDATYG